MSMIVSSQPFFPPSLPKGGTIGLVAPSRWPDPAWVEAAKSRFEKRGHKVVVHDQVKLRHGQQAGTAQEAVAALHSLFADPSVNAIVCARGGNGALRLLDLLDYDLIACNPKPFIGFSDATVLLNAIAKKSGFVTYHGPMGWNFSEGQYDQRTEEDLFAVLSGVKEKTYPVDVVRAGAAQGQLVGGNITLLRSLVGTPYDWTAKDGLLFIEDGFEYLYKMANDMAHLRLAGKFEGVRAVIVGEICDVADERDPQDPPYGMTAKEIILEHLPPDVPVVFDFPCGHGKYLTTLPVGAQAKVLFEGRQARIEFIP